jgi:hypothetical protein
MIYSMSRSAAFVGAVAALAVALVTSGCGHLPSPTVGKGASSPAAPASPAADSFVGIILLTCTATASDLDDIRLIAYDPAAGRAPVTRDFQATATIGPPPVACGGPEQVVRPLFNGDLTELAATSTSNPDGGSHIGYLPQSGVFVDLTPQAGGVAVPQQSLAVFNPASGRLWYADRNSSSRFGSIDPAAGAGTGRVEPVATGVPATQPFRFTTDGQQLISDADTGIYTPDGTARIYYDSAKGFRLGLTSVPSGGYPALALAGAAPAAHCRLAEFIDDQSFLCTGDGTTGNPYGIYRMDLNDDRTQVKQTALLADTNGVPVTRLAVDPTRSRVAFVAGGTILYTIGLDSDRGTPVRVADLSTVLGPGTSFTLACWR